MVNNDSSRKSEDDNSGLEDLKLKLYRRNYKVGQTDVLQEFYSRKENIREDWGEEVDKKNVRDGRDDSGAQSIKDTSKMFKKMLIVSFLFFIVALGGTLWLFFGGGNIVSSDNVDISILGPVSIAGGDELSLQISITNNNNTALKFTDLVVSYPDGANDTSDVTKELPRYRVSLDAIEPGETVNEIVRSIFFGEEGSEKTVIVSIEYRVDGSNAIFAKEESYTFSINSSPVSVSVKALKEVNTNQEMDLRVTVASNSDTAIDKVALIIEYPFGFEPIAATPSSTYGNNVWELGTLQPESEKEFVISGIMRAQDNEEKIFGIYVGKQDNKKEREIATVYSSSFEEVLVKKPFIGVSMRVNGESDDQYVALSGENITTDITWINNLTTGIKDAVLEARIEGEALDIFSVSVDGGFYNSTTHTIVWDKNSLPQLASLYPGETGRVSFRFSPRSLLGSGASDIREPHIDISISVRGKRDSQSGASEEVKEFVTRKILVNSELQLTSRSVYFSGPIVNSGPLPPKVGQATSYTILWSVVNSSNDISGARVSAVLPSYMQWGGEVTPRGESISTDASNGEIVWNIGDISAGVGVSRTAREVAFRVVLVPSVSQIGKIPAIMNNIVLSGKDNFTGDIIQFTRPSLTTNLSTDSAFNQTQAQVVSQ